MPQITGKEVGDGNYATGYGLMGLTWTGGPTPHSQAFAAMRAALATGANFWNGGEFYGTPEANSLHLLNAYFAEYAEDAEKVVLCVKGGLNMAKRAPDGSPEFTRRSVDECLRVLDGKKFLDLFECARVDPNTPVEETIETLAEYVKEGKLGGISLSECSANTIRRAAKVHKIEAVEVEFSLFSTEILENGVAKTCAELGIPIVAYSPLGRGLLTGKIKSKSDFPAIKLQMPRFQDGALEKNLKLVDEVEKLAKRKGCTPGQIAISWVKAHSGRDGLPIIIPIPGTTTQERVLENNKDVELTDADLKELDRIIKTFEVTGGRYGPPFAALEFGDSPELKR